MMSRFDLLRRGSDSTASRSFPHINDDEVGLSVFPSARYPAMLSKCCVLQLISLA